MCMTHPHEIIPIKGGFILNKSRLDIELGLQISYTIDSQTM